MSDSSIHELLAALSDGRYSVRAAAAEALVRRPEPRAVEALIGALRDRENYIRATAAEALIRIGAPAIKALVPLVTDKVYDVRHRACHALTSIDPDWANSVVARNAIPAFVATLKDDSSDARRMVADILESAGWEPPDVAHRALFARARMQWDQLVALGPPVVPLLEDSLDDADSHVRLGAAEALGMLGNPRGMEFLLANAADGAYVGTIEAIVGALERVFPHAAASVALDFLHAVISLPDTFVCDAEQAVPGMGWGWTENVEHWVACLPVKRLAAEELRRRGCVP